jgi:hypothetical protein
MLKTLPKQTTSPAPAKPKQYKGGDMGGQTKCSHTKGTAYPTMGSYKSGGKAK